MTLPTVTALPTPPSRSDEPATFITRADALLAALPALVTEVNSFGAALPVEAAAVNYNGVSTTSLTVGTGSQALTINTGRLLQVGQFVLVASTASPQNYMYGQITAHNSSTGALTVNVSAVGGAGTFTAWTISLAALSASYATVSGIETLTNKTLTAPVINNGALTDPVITGAILEDIYTITDGAAFEIDPSNGTMQIIVLGASRTPKATNFANGESVMLMIDDGTAYALTWTDTTFGASGVKWVYGTAPTLATTGYTLVEFFKVAGQVYGALVGSVA